MPSYDQPGITTYRRTALALLVAAASLVLGAAGSPGAGIAGSSAAGSRPDLAVGALSAAQPAAGPAAGASGSEVTKTVKWRDSVGKSRVGSVTVSKTKQLSTREIVSISWHGFLPTEQPDGVESTHQAPQAPTRSAYPVVILECQGADPATVTPEDCPLPQRFLYSATTDALESKEVQASSPYDSRPFRDTSGKLLTAPGIYQPVPVPSDYSDANVIGTNWYATWTETDGSRTDAKFEVRSTKEAPQSLGCGDPTTRQHGACSIVVVPIRPMHCINATACLPPQETNAYSASYLQWQSASNWQNRVVFPVTFKPFPDVCDLDSRPAVPTQGSQLLDEAMLSWVPKFCGSSDLFKLSFTRTNDPAARAALTTGSSGTYQSNLAFTTKPVASTRDRPVVNAPVAVTGFVVAFAIDDKGYEEVDSMRLDARLLAKLVTESYYAPPVPYLSKNPSDLLHDPEFRQLNPEMVKSLDPLATIDNPILVQGNPDLVSEVTRYIASDPQATAWLDGKPDPWGMTVNPHYQGKQWPVPNDQFALRDPWTDKADTSQCTAKPVLEKQSQFVFDLLAATIALVDRQPQNFGVCKVSGQGGDVWSWAKPDRQPLGRRSLLAITDLAHAQQFQLPSAALQTQSGTFVSPTPTSLADAVKVATVDKRTQTILSDMDTTSKTAYPGMMAVYAAAPTKGLSDSDAASYAKMISWMATDGQIYGDAAGRLPAGYLSLPDSMRKQAVADAEHVSKQDGSVAPDANNPPPTTTPNGGSGAGPTSPSGSPPPPGSATGPGASPGSVPPALPNGAPAGSPAGTPAGGGAIPPGATPSSGAPSSTVPRTSTPTTGSDQPLAGETVHTVSESSSLAHNLLPILLVLTIGGLVVSPLLLLSGRVSALGGVREFARRRLTRGGRS